MTGLDLEATAGEELRELSAAELRTLAAALAERNRQLQEALDSRVMIEQAKGMLAERLDIEVPAAFELLRSAARSSRRRLHDVALELVTSRECPPELSRLVRTREAAARLSA